MSNDQPGADHSLGLATLDAVAAGITVQDASGRLVYANHAAASLIGVPGVDALLRANPGELMAAFEVLDEQGRPLPAAELPGRRVLDGKGPSERLLRFHTRGDGGERWALVAARALPVGAGGPLLVVNTFIDAGEVVRSQRRAEEEARLAQETAERLATSERRYRALADLVPSQVWTAQPDGRLDYVNRRALDYFGRTAEEILAGGWRLLVHTDDLPRCVDRWTEALESGQPYEVELRLRRADGAHRWHLVRALPVRAADGRIHHWVGANNDISERVQAEEARSAVVAEMAARRATEEGTARTQEVLAAISDAFAVCTRDWVVVFANEESGKRLGKRPHEVIGRDLWELVPGAAGTSFEGALRRAMQERAVTRLEDRVDAAGDQWMELIAYPLPDGGLAMYSRDVTSRKREEQTRARQAAYDALRAEVAGVLAGRGDLRSLLQACCEAVVRHLPLAFARAWLLDGSGDWLDLEASAGKYAEVDGGHRRVPVGGGLKIAAVAAERRPQITNAVLGDERVSAWVRREGIVALAGYPLAVGDRLLGVLAAFAAAPLPEGTAAALERTADLIAHGLERRRAEVELDERARELARSNAELEQFAYVASHDLQEPLRIVASYTQLLARRYQGRLDPDADDFISFSVEGINRMQRLISDLLAYSRVGSRPRTLASVDVGRALAIALENLAHAMTDAGASVTHGPLPAVTGDEGQLVQLMQNLVGNAIKFHGATPPVVHVSARPGDREWIFAVTDNGVGIEPQYFERIFVIFQRLHARESYPGTGIGLALCKKIVERHGGRMWVESTPGSGSTFFFALPCSEAG
jgi:PAS domain S-box-containing protein